MNFAVASRRLQFEAGPEQHTFYACREHRRILDSGDVSCFFAYEKESVKDEDEETEIECDFCREGGY